MDLKANNSFRPFSQPSSADQLRVSQSSPTLICEPTAHLSGLHRTAGTQSVIPGNCYAPVKSFHSRMQRPNTTPASSRIDVLQHTQTITSNKVDNRESSSTLPALQSSLVEKPFDGVPIKKELVSSLFLS